MGEISTASIDSLRVPSLKKPVGSVRGLWHGPTTGIPHKSHQETLAIYGYPSQIACQRPINQSINQSYLPDISPVLLFRISPICSVSPSLLLNSAPFSDGYSSFHPSALCSPPKSLVNGCSSHPNRLFRCVCWPIFKLFTAFFPIPRSFLRATTPTPPPRCRSAPNAASFRLRCALRDAGARRGAIEAAARWLTPEERPQAAQ